MITDGVDAAEVFEEVDKESTHIGPIIRPTANI